MGSKLKALGGCSSHHVQGAGHIVAATLQSALVRLDALALSVIATATWLGGWLGDCHSRYCIKTTKPIRKLFGPSGRPIIYAFRTPYADTKFHGEPLHRGR